VKLKLVLGSDAAERIDHKMTALTEAR